MVSAERDRCFEGRGWSLKVKHGDVECVCVFVSLDNRCIHNGCKLPYFLQSSWVFMVACNSMVSAPGSAS